MSTKPADEIMNKQEERNLIGATQKGNGSAVGRSTEGETIEYILKIPRSIDPQVASMINERHMRFVQEETMNFYLALKHGESLSSVRKGPSHQRKRERAGGDKS